MILAVPVGIRVDADGFRKDNAHVFQDVFATLYENWEIGIQAGGVRGAVRNTAIAAFQAAMDRDPWFLNGTALEQVKFLIGGLTSSVSAVRLNAAREIGNVMLQSIRENVARQLNKDGSPFRELKTGYALRKQKALGFIKPIMRATGDLLDHLKVRVVRG
jgi:hypothetical protein